MKEFKGTKGEWVACFDYTQVIFDKHEMKDCDLYTHQYDDEKEMKANAKLIAAAPDLLEALQVSVRALRLEGWTDKDRIIQRANATISKALD